MGMSAGGGGGVKAEPNVTPMIDVMLVLLIIFMIIVPALQSGMQADPPQGQNLKPHPEDDNDVLLGIDKGGNYFLKKVPIRKEDFPNALDGIYNKTGREDHVLYVKADANLEYEKVLEALDIASRHGVNKAALITDQRGGTKSVIVTDNWSMTPAGGKK